MRRPYIPFPEFEFAKRLFPNAGLTPESYTLAKSFYTNLVDKKVRSINWRQAAETLNDKQRKSIELMQKAIIHGACKFHRETLTVVK